MNHWDRLTTRLRFALRSRLWTLLRGSRLTEAVLLGLLSLAVLAAGLSLAPAPLFWLFGAVWVVGLALLCVAAGPRGTPAPRSSDGES
ncbi:hypothetical protein ACIGXM_09560 [Kitasatospora sp. NPDC052896]|uniref:hypothetical protein n=1 Tax=Kitasatospora sp. NPDC052896 TaxID=3364061 RepID=UPI0037CBBD30